jgi:hypothetical protein
MANSAERMKTAAAILVQCHFAESAFVSSLIIFVLILAFQTSKKCALESFQRERQEALPIA